MIPLTALEGLKLTGSRLQFNGETVTATRGNRVMHLHKGKYYDAASLAFYLAHGLWPAKRPKFLDDNPRNLAVANLILADCRADKEKMLKQHAKYMGSVAPVSVRVTKIVPLNVLDSRYRQYLLNMKQRHAMEAANLAANHAKQLADLKERHELRTATMREISGLEESQMLIPPLPIAGHEWIKHEGAWLSIREAASVADDRQLRILEALRSA